MKGTPDQESEILTAILALKDDPVGFAHYAYPWGAKGTSFETLRAPRRWQADDLCRIGEHVQEQVFRLENGMSPKVWKQARSSGRGPGKSAEMGIVAHWHTSTRIGAPTIVTANTESQLRTKTFPEFAVWFGAAVNSHWFTIDSLRIAPAPWLIEIVKKLENQFGG